MEKDLSCTVILPLNVGSGIPIAAAAALFDIPLLFRAFLRFSYIYFTPLFVMFNENSLTTITV